MVITTDCRDLAYCRGNPIKYIRKVYFSKMSPVLYHHHYNNCKYVCSQKQGTIRVINYWTFLDFSIENLFPRVLDVHFKFKFRLKKGQGQMYIQIQAVHLRDRLMKNLIYNIPLGDTRYVFRISKFVMLAFFRILLNANLSN